MDYHRTGPAGGSSAAGRRCPGLRHRRTRRHTRHLRPRPGPLRAPRTPVPQGPGGAHPRCRHGPAYQRRGYAKAALAAFLEHLEQEGVTLYELYASEGSAPLYESLGSRATPR
ncbi:GNAT family N-acetyltransferase [Streptomyces sp. NBC_00846]|uniref:GNAT family N-acetyltransferase n=1 Tax=Streptomyces sp. NBC_00846 TaxID=2975849 RepID=UPI00386739F2